MRVTDASNLSDLFGKRVSLSPQALAYRQYTKNSWINYTWLEAAEQLSRWQSALRSENLSAGDRVAICLHNRFEWVLFEQAALALDLVVVPLYFNDRADNMAWCIQDSGAKLLLLEDGDLWPELRDQVQGVQRVICLERVVVNDESVIALHAWLPDQVSAPTYSSATGDQLASIVYTSGTTGRSKGVMLTHNNILSNAQSLGAACQEIGNSDLFLSFLPLSHMFERTVGYYAAMVVCAQTAFNRGIKQLKDDLVEQSPTVIVSVPRIFERLYGKLMEDLPEGSFKRKLFNQAVNVGWKRWQGKASLFDHLQWPILNLLIAKKLQAAFGGCLRYVLLGGAPMPAHLFEVFIGLGLTFLHGYGLTETSPVISFNRADDNDPFSVGSPLGGIEVKIGDNQELLARGPNIMTGYWQNQQATDQVIDRHGWFHTGDQAKIEKNHIYITGRVKDIIVLSNGEKVSPADVEDAILADPWFEQVMLVGEGRAKLGLLVVSQVNDDSALCKRANARLHAFPGYAKIYYLANITDPWTVENGLLTPTLKIKRKAIAEHYAEVIEGMYNREDIC